MQTGCRGAPVPLAIWFANHPSAAARECWIQNGIRDGMQTGVQSSTSAAGDLVCKPPLSCCQRMRDPAGRRGLVGQSACLVNRRSWILCFSNCIPIVQRPKDLVLPTHRARNLTPMDWHKEKNFLWGSVGLCGAMDSALDF